MIIAHQFSITQYLDIQERVMKWSTPKYSDMPYGFEVITINHNN